jgi:hypothetical protein
MRKVIPVTRAPSIWANFSGVTSGRSRSPRLARTGLGSAVNAATATLRLLGHCSLVRKASGRRRIESPWVVGLPADVVSAVGVVVGLLSCAASMWLVSAQAVAPGRAIAAVPISPAVSSLVRTGKEWLSSICSAVKPEKRQTGRRRHE